MCAWLPIHFATQCSQRKEAPPSLAVPACTHVCVPVCLRASLLTAPPLPALLLLAATAVDLDEAVIRRMPRRIFVPLPDATNRQRILQVGVVGCGGLQSAMAVSVVTAGGRGASAWGQALRTDTLLPLL